MRFRNSFHLLMDNFGLVYKMLLYKIIVGLFAVGLFFALIYPNLLFIIEAEQFAAIGDELSQFFNALLSGNSEYLMAFRDNFSASLNELLALVTSRAENIVWSIVGLIVCILLTRFLDSLGNYAFSRMLNDKMNSYSDSAFFDCFIRSLGKASVYSVCYVSITFMYDFVVISGCYFLLFGLAASVSVFVSIFFTVTVGFVLQSLKLTLFTNWVPAMIEGGMGNKEAFSYGFTSKVKYRMKMFSTYLITLYIIVVINVLFGICTLSSGLLITVPASFLFLTCLQFVNFYTIEGKKYFVTQYKIAENKDRGEHKIFVDEKDGEE